MGNFQSIFESILTSELLPFSIIEYSTSTEWILLSKRKAIDLFGT